MAALNQVNPTWEVHFRNYCYGCRRGARWHGRCLWANHRYDWDYTVRLRGIRVVQRGSFKSFDLAHRSASRSLSQITRALAR